MSDDAGALAAIIRDPDGSPEVGRLAAAAQLKAKLRKEFAGLHTMGLPRDVIIEAALGAAVEEILEADGPDRAAAVLRDLAGLVEANPDIRAGSDGGWLSAPVAGSG